MTVKLILFILTEITLVDVAWLMVTTLDGTYYKKSKFKRVITFLIPIICMGTNVILGLIT